MRAAVAGNSGLGSVMETSSNDRASFRNPCSCRGGRPPVSRAAMDNPLAEPVLRSQSAQRRGGWIRRSLRWLGRALALFIGISVVVAALYRFIPPPVTPLMVIRLTDGNWISKDWDSYDDISPNLARAVIAAEDSGFCAHWGFDFEAIQEALRH